MCGRFTHEYTWAEIHAYYSLVNASPPELTASWNVAPTQQVGVVVEALRGASGATGAMYLEMRWGLIPSWAEDVSIGSRLINARAETVAQKPAFRSAFQHRRCVIPASGFYEWKRLEQASPKKGGAKQPFYVTMASGEPLSFAGLWEQWRPDGGPEIVSCTIITTSANEAIAPIHDRMPVILGREGAREWLRAADVSLLRPCPSAWLRAWPVSTRVNNTRVDDPSLIDPEPV
jgi:putative SOS response-associated peptidase YedK